ncbi:hypothetical protein GP486_000239 [Trichoglossum hirsutum]|uniref:Uncharacterized protein n=1 Tax=Trichoglossum hirsutum TaxID=265104 RepID=A0A9P8RTR2_9PEZI|nr:hypothetical protein GP486_000239 [Trichoglossum hirsutum]
MCVSAFQPATIVPAAEVPTHVLPPYGTGGKIGKCLIWGRREEAIETVGEFSSYPSSQLGGEGSDDKSLESLTKVEGFAAASRGLAETVFEAHDIVSGEPSVDPVTWILLLK